MNPYSHGRARWALFAALLVVPATSIADIEASGGWSRASVPGTTVGVGYLVIKNTGTQTRKLLRITSTVSDTVMLHQSSVDAQGVARMWPMASLELRAGESVRFEPNGRHIMLVDLKTPLKAGGRVPLTLEFDGGERLVTVQLEIRSLLSDVTPNPHAQHAH
jgi:periplasmic copper chaperone A